MSMLLALALRNLTRNLRRTLISSVSVIAGVAVLILGNGFVDGLDENVIRAQEDGLSGHIALTPAGYPEDGLTLPLEEARPVDGELARHLADPRVTAWAPRLWTFTRLVSGPDSMRARLLGYDPERDPQVYPRDTWKVQGSWPSAPDQVALGAGLADTSDIHLGDVVTLETRTKAGALNALQFTVGGIITTRNGALDNIAVWLPLPVADDLTRSEGARSLVGVRLGGGRSAAEDADSWLVADGWRSETATHAVADILAINDFRRSAISLVVFILMLIAFTGIASTVIMATYERVREIGTLRAMGMGPMRIRGLFLLEGAAMGTAASLLGALIGGAVVWHYAAVGIDLSEAVKNGASSGELSFSTMLYLHYSWAQVIRAVLFGAVVAVIASFYPAHRAATLNPADAVRAE